MNNYNKELIEIKKQLVDIQKRLDKLLDSDIEDNSNLKSKTKIEINNKKNNAEFFRNYLLGKKLNPHSIDNYFVELRNIEKFLAKELDIILSDPIIYINDIDEINNLRNILFDNDVFVNKNLKGHHRMSAAINNYYSFLKSKKYRLVLDE